MQKHHVIAIEKKTIAKTGEKCDCKKLVQKSSMS
jgi:hypothetical protein